MPSGAVDASLAEMDEALRARVERLEAGERRLRAMAMVSRKVAAHAARVQLEKERRRLGRELHTGVGQLLAAIRIQLELIDHLLPQPPVPVAEALQRISDLAADALDQVRGVSHELYMPEWQRMPLSQAIEGLWIRTGMPQRYEGGLRLWPLPAQPSTAAKALIYRAAQEAISNIIRHSQATWAELALEAADKTIVLIVSDNGVGLSTDQRTENSMGLRALRDEAAALRAELSLEDAKPGTRLRLSVPIAC